MARPLNLGQVFSQLVGCQEGRRRRGLRLIGGGATIIKSKRLKNWCQIISWQIWIMIHKQTACVVLMYVAKRCKTIGLWFEKPISMVGKASENGEDVQQSGEQLSSSNADSGQPQSSSNSDTDSEQDQSITSTQTTPGKPAATDRTVGGPYEWRVATYKRKENGKRQRTIVFDDGG